MFDKPVTIFALWRYALWLFVFTFVAAFVMTFLSGEPISNSEGFIHRSQKYLLRLAFFTSNRPFTTDLFYKIWGSNPYQVVAGQKVFAVFCWTFLGLAVSHTMRNSFPAMLALLIFSSIVLWWNVGGWVNVMRSESLAFSFFALWYGCIILLRETKSWRIFVLLCLVTVFFSFTRDNIPYFLFLFAMFTLVFAKSGDAKKQWLAYFVIVLIVAILQSVSAQIGKRHQFPLINVIFKRILPYQDRVHFFQSRGMPVDAEFIETWKDQWASSHNWALYHNKDSKYKPFMDFTLHKGKYVYGQFLLTHPVYAVKRVWNDRKNVFSLNQYSHTNDPPSYALVQISSWFWNYCAWLIKNLLPVILVLSVLIVKRDAFPLIAIVCILCNALLIYHADAMEVERHSLIVLIVLSVVLVHLVFIYADMVVNRIKVWKNLHQ